MSGISFNSGKHRSFLKMMDYYCKLPPGKKIGTMETLRNMLEPLGEIIKEYNAKELKHKLVAISTDGFTDNSHNFYSGMTYQFINGIELIKSIHMEPEEKRDAESLAKHNAQFMDNVFVATTDNCATEIATIRNLKLVINL